MSKQIVIVVDKSTRIAAWGVVAIFIGIGFLIGRWVG